jgi:hypothetical protein
MAQQIINVGTAPNDGLGDPIRTAFTKTNDNFSQLYSRVQTSPPTTLVGSVGDQAGMYAFDSSYFYYCFANYDGSSIIWAELTSLGNVSATQIQNGNSSIQIADINGNANVSIRGTSNVAVFSNSGVKVNGIVSAVGNISSNYFLGNGAFLSGLPATYSNANVADFLPVYSGNIAGDYLFITRNANISGNTNVQGIVSATGNIVTSGYFVGDFAGNITGNFTVPGSNTQVLFNTSGNADAVGGMTYNKDANTFIVLGVISSQGNVIAGNLTTGAQVVATGNITGGNINTGGNVTGSNILTAGVVSAGGNVRGGNINTAGLVTATGNVTGGNIVTGGIITSAGNIYTGSTVQAINVNASGNISANIHTGTSVSVTGNVTANNIVGNTITGTLSSGSQTSITAVGTLTSLAVSGNITPGGISMSTGNAVIGNLYVSGNTTIAGNITQVSGNSGQFFGNASTGFNALYAGLPSGFNLLPQSVVNYISSYNGYSQINNQNISAGNTATTDYILTSNNGDDNTYYFDMGIAGSTYNGSVAILNNALGNSVTPNDAYLYVTGNVAAGNPSDLVIGTPDAGSQIRIISGGSTTANVSVKINAPNTQSTTATTGTMVVTGGIASNNSLFVTNTANVGNLITPGTITVNSGNAATAIVNGGANAVGNIGSNSRYFNTAFVNATSAQYADLAECYLGDAYYVPGTVVSFGGPNEVTFCDTDQDPAVAGVVSTNPAYKMNTGLEGEYVTTVALVGRVPCQVQGPVSKGSLMVSAGNGLARAEKQPLPGTIIGKALENFDGELGTIEIVVGRV